MRPLAKRQIVILAYPGAQSLDITGPFEVFAGAQQLIEREARACRGYELRVLGPGGERVRSSSGLEIVPHGALGDPARALDTLIVPGGPGHEQACADPQLVRWIACAARSSRRTASVCTGAFLLARAGLLDGRRATTHWAFAARLARAHPLVRVDPDPIFVRDGRVWSSAGVTAGMDLALALVEEDLDREAALALARALVMFLRRPGNQSQFSAALSAREPAREPLRDTIGHILESPGEDHSVEAMAARSHMSPRHFARSFLAETGVTPARYVERVRVEAARALLEDSSQPVASIAAACGFGTAETMRRVFLRSLRVGPAEYRRRFQASDERREAA